VPPSPPSKRPPVETGPGQPDAEAKTTARVIDGQVLGHDPQLAVGDRFVILYEAHRYEVLDKASGKLVAARGPADEIAPSGDFATLFSPLWSPRDKHGRPNAENVNLALGFAPGDPKKCDPERPDASTACFQEFYDARMLWDASRKRFWIETAIRNHLWSCRHGGPCDGEKESNTQGRRFIAIGVSRTEDPRDGFHRYALVREGDLADWPKMALHDHYLILSHRGKPEVYVFDADKLADGNPGRGKVRVAKIDVREYGLKFFDPVNHHGETDGATYLLGSDGGDRIKVLALVNRDPTRATPPDVVPGKWIEITRKVGTLENNAVWRGGFLTATWDECAVPGIDGCDGVRQVHVLRLPARLDGSGASVVVVPRRAAGFLDFAFGGRDVDDDPQDRIDYQKPALDVNKNGDTVIVYARRGAETAHELDPEVRYSILYHGEPRPRAGVLVRKGGWFEVPDIDDNSKAGIDLAYAQVDPSDDRSVWVTHAYADRTARWYRQVAAVVAP
jgi:hypothetical protein